jgi:aerobic carbon-monoxide dehydrogenase small subunit
VTLHVRINGTAREIDAGPEIRLIDVLRDQLGLTGTKEGCSVGVCGACSVLVDGEVMSACLVPAVSVDGMDVTTIEGVAADRLQEAFITEGGFQCGICTPGQIVSATALLHENPAPTREEIKHWMMGNLCRCTGYYKIAESIEAAAAMMRGEQPPPPGIA